MAPSNWNDDKIISSLKEMPKIEDKRSKELLFQKIHGELNETSNLKKRRKRPIMILPSLATAAVFAILLLIVPPFFEDGLGTNKSAPNTADEGQFRTEMFSKLEIKGEYIGSLQEIPEDQEIITMYYPDAQIMRLVPISFPVEKGSNKLEAVKHIIENFPVEKYGLAESAIKDLVFVDGDEPSTVQVNVPEGSLVNLGSSGEAMLLDTVNRTFADLGYKKVQYMTEGTPGGIQFPNTGVVDVVELEKPDKVGFIPFLTGTGHIFLYDVVYFKEDAVDISNVNELLKESEEGITGSPILTKPFSVEKKGESELVVTFSEGLEDNGVDRSIIDSILLTANKFGYTKVKFKGVKLDRIGKYNLDAPVNVPVGPNFISMEKVSKEEDNQTGK